MFPEKTITVINYFDSKFFAIAAFCFSKGMKLTCHDHPKMVVVGKVLLGDL